MISTRFDVTLWDCGCLTWTEENRLMHLPCGQKTCRVTKIVLEESKSHNNKIVTLKIEEADE